MSEDGKAIQNFLENTSEENLNIHFNDETSLIYDDPDNATTKGEVRQRNFENGKFTYDLAYRYPQIQGHNADFRLAHEMGHLMLNPSNSNRQIYDKESNSRQVSGLIRRNEEDGQFYGTQIQENAINLIAQLAVRGEHSADDIMSGKVDLSEFNLYKKADDLVKILAVSMRNDYEKEMSFEQLAEQKQEKPQQVQRYERQNENKLTIRQRIAQFLQRNDILMNIPFVEKFVDKQLNVLPPPTEQRTSTRNSSRESFVNMKFATEYCKFATGGKLKNK